MKLFIPVDLQSTQTHLIGETTYPSEWYEKHEIYLEMKNHEWIERYLSRANDETEVSAICEHTFFSEY